MDWFSIAIYAAFAVVGYLARAKGILLPGMPVKPPEPAEPKPADPEPVPPATPSEHPVLDALAKLLAEKALMDQLLDRLRKVFEATAPPPQNVSK